MRSLEGLDHKLKPFGRTISISPFIVAIVCALLFKVASIMVRADIGLGLVAAVAGAWILANYFFEIIEHRAIGAAHWPVLSIETLFSMRRQLGLVFALIVVGIVLLGIALDAVGLRTLSRLFGVMVALVLPVSAAMLAVTRSVLRAVDPIKLLAAAARLEMGYIVILIASFVVWLVATRAAASGSLVLLLLTSYGYLLLGYVIGSVVFARRASLGVRTRYAPEDRAEVTSQALEREREAALDHAYSFAGRGNIRGALEHIAAYARTEADPLDAELWLFQKMTLWEDPTAVLALGRDLSERLTAAGRGGQASKVDAMRDFVAKRARARTRSGRAGSDGQVNA